MTEKIDVISYGLLDLLPRDGRIQTNKAYRDAEGQAPTSTDLYGHIREINDTGILVYTDNGDIVFVPTSNVRAVELFMKTGEGAWV